MGEIKLTRIKSLYGETKGYLEAINRGHASSGPYTIPRSIVDNFNKIVDELSKVSETDYSRSKIPENELREVMSIRLVEPLVAGLVNRLEQEYGFGNGDSNIKPTIAIFNRNQNSNSIEINYSINDLIVKEENEESKSKLNELNNELKKDKKDWEIIKNILIWMLNFSKDLFIQVIPILLEKKL